MIRCNHCALLNTPTEDGESCNRCGKPLPRPTKLLAPCCAVCRMFVVVPGGSRPAKCYGCDRVLVHTYLTPLRLAVLLRACAVFALFIQTLGFDGVAFRALPRVLMLGDEDVETAILHAVQRYAGTIRDDLYDCEAGDVAGMAARFADCFVDLLAGVSPEAVNERIDDLIAESAPVLTAYLDPNEPA